MRLIVVEQIHALSLYRTRGQSLEDDLRLLLDANPKRYVAALTLCSKLASLWELYLDRDVRFTALDVGILFPVFQTQPAVHVMGDRLRIPGGYHGFGAHQDWPTLQGSLDTVTVWIPLTPVGPENFTMEVAPGSHKSGLYPSERKDNIFEVQGEITNWTPIVAQTGDVVFMSAFTVHRSSQEGAGLRIASSMRYENAAEPTFVERGYPFAHKRVVQQDLITPDFPTAEQVRRIFD